MTTNYKALFSNLISDESGQDLIEYALVAALIALGAIASMRTLGSTIVSTFGSVNTSLAGAV